VTDPLLQELKLSHDPLFPVSEHPCAVPRLYPYELGIEITKVRVPSLEILGWKYK